MKTTLIWEYKESLASNQCYEDICFFKKTIDLDFIPPLNYSLNLLEKGKKYKFLISRGEIDSTNHEMKLYSQMHIPYYQIHNPDSEVIINKIREMIERGWKLSSINKKYFSQNIKL